MTLKVFRTNIGSVDWNENTGTGTFQCDFVVVTQNNPLLPQILVKFTMKLGTVFILISLLALTTLVVAKKATNENKPEWAKKDIRDYNEADLERLLDQWEVSWLFVNRREDDKILILGRRRPTGAR